MRKALTYISFAISSLLVILAFVTTTTYLQLGVAILLYPLIAFFAYNIFLVKNKNVPAPTISAQSTSLNPKMEKSGRTITKREDVSITDIDKRAFLKLMGATGLSFFLFSLFNRKSEALFFGKPAAPGISALTNTAGNKIDPSERQPMDGYAISEIDESFIAYYGFTNNYGAWYIIKEDPVVGSFRYIKGDSDFSSNWISRQNLNYDYYHNIFP